MIECDMSFRHAAPVRLILPEVPPEACRHSVNLLTCKRCAYPLDFVHEASPFNSSIVPHIASATAGSLEE